MGNNCQSDSTQLERIIRGSENTFSDLYSLLSQKLSEYLQVSDICCVGKCTKLKDLLDLLDEYIESEDQYGDIVIDIIDKIIDKLLEDTPVVATQYTAAFYNEKCVEIEVDLPLKGATLDFNISFQNHTCILFEELLPDFTYEATYTDFVCSFDQGELFPYAYEAVFMGHNCILQDGNYFYPEYSASFIDFVCEFEPACDTFSTVLCTSSELCELSMTSEWLDYSCFIAERDFDISFADHSCIKNMNYEASFQNHICVLELQQYLASFIDFVCILEGTCLFGVNNSAIYQPLTTTTTTVAPVTTTTTSIVSTTTTTSEVTTTTTTISGVYPVKYGALYNWYVVADARNIASVGWRRPLNTDFISLNAIITVTADAWDELDGGTDPYNFNLRKAGIRNRVTGTFSDINSDTDLTGTTSFDANRSSWNRFRTSVVNPFIQLNGSESDKAQGASIRLVKESTTLSNGQTGTYTGNDGKVYRTICINGIEWMADNLLETKYRNGDWITGYDGGVYTPISNANWAAKTDEAMCFYGDIEGNG